MIDSESVFGRYVRGILGHHFRTTECWKTKSGAARPPDSNEDISS
jgi:hypothetical protein